jgi:hypothetical protein
VSEQQTNYFVEMAKIDVGKYIEKKGGFNYLSWAWAVDYLRRQDPTATWEIIRFDGKPFMKTECGYFVEVAVTCHGVTLSQVHPVLDNRNKPIEKPNAFQINTSIQRCLAKAIALHGLGLYIYQGEDLPEIEMPNITDSIREKWAQIGGKPDVLERWFGNQVQEGKTIIQIEQFLDEKIEEKKGA